MNTQSHRSYRRLAVLLIAALLWMTSCESSANRNGEAVGKVVREEAMPPGEDTISLRFFTGKSPNNTDRFEETLVWRKYADATNVQVHFELVPFDSLTDERALALAGETLPDAFYSARLSDEELARYGKQGVLIPLDELIERHAPNFQALLEKYPMLRKGLTMPDGHIYSFPSFYDPAYLSMQIGTPLWVNKSWLDQLGLEEPRTTEQFRDYLRAVRDHDLNGNGEHDEIPYSAVGIGTLLNQLRGAWGLGNRGVAHKFVDVEPATGDLRFTRIQPGYKEMLQYIHSLKTEGLLDRELFSIKENALNAKGNSGLLGAAIVPNPATVMGRDEFIGLGALEGPHGDRLYTQMKSPLVHKGAFAITSANPYPEETVKWMDWFYGEEGATFFFMGEEGVTYTRHKDGTLEYLPSITTNLKGLTQDQALMPYVTWLGGSYPGFVQEKYFRGSESHPGSLEAAEKAKPDMAQEVWVPFVFDEEEASFMSTIGAELESYVYEMDLKFVNGDVPFTEWDNYTATLKTMGLNEYLKFYERAYARYNAVGE